jgi:hypothetical protein
MKITINTFMNLSRWTLRRSDGLEICQGFALWATRAEAVKDAKEFCRLMGKPKMIETKGTK